MSMLKETSAAVREDDKLVIGDSDVVEEIPPELRSVMARNSEELETLPGQCLVKAPQDGG